MMSTKSTIILTNDYDEHIYFDCVNVVNDIDSEISFEFSKKHIQIDDIDEDYICFTLNKDTEMYRFFQKLFRNK
jgi:hypothetical protein